MDGWKDFTGIDSDDPAFQRFMPLAQAALHLDPAFAEAERQGKVGWLMIAGDRDRKRASVTVSASTIDRKTYKGLPQIAAIPISDDTRAKLVALAWMIMAAKGGRAFSFSCERTVNEGSATLSAARRKRSRDTLHGLFKVAA